MSLREKIIFGYFLALGIAVIGAVSGLQVGNYYQKQALRAREIASRERQLLSKLQIAILYNRPAKQLFPYLQQPEKFHQESAAIRERIADINAILLNYRALESTSNLPELPTLLTQYAVQVEEFSRRFEVFVQRIELLTTSPQLTSEAEKLLLTLVSSQEFADFIEFPDQLQQVLVLAEKQEQQAVNALAKAEVLRSQIIIIGLLLSIAIAALLAIHTSQEITRPLKAVTQIAQRVTHESNFNLRVDINSTDEVGQLANSLNQLIEHLGIQTGELNAIIDNLGDGLLVADREGKIKRTNHNLLGMCPLPGKELTIDKSCREVFGSDLARLITENQANPTQMLTAEVQLADGRVGQALVTAIITSTTKNSVSDCLGSVVLIRDITFEREIDRIKTDFIATVSHELRTPLTSVLGFAKLVKKKLAKTVLPQVNQSEPKTQKATQQVLTNLDIIICEGERLTNLIADILDIAKIEAGKLEWRLEPVSVATIIEQAIATTSVLLQGKNIQLIQEIEPNLPIISGDRDRLIQVVINLIANASKFTQQGSVTCCARLVKQQVLVSVIDTGVGLARENWQRVFDKFQQVGDTLTDKPQGTGLGLPICKQIIEHHGGRIWVTSKIGQGSNFSFTLPVSSQKTAEREKMSV